jgi:molybdopterin-guanine dinucleotide biosynthesis protein A
VYDAIVLAGGKASRLGGVDKGSVDVGGQTLLQRVLTATGDARTTIVVGPKRDLPYGVLATTEEPPGGGPVAGVSAGLQLVGSPLIVLLACDLPFLTTRTIERLVDALDHDRDRAFDGAQLVDDDGRSQPLAAAYRTSALITAIGRLDAVDGTPMRDVVGNLRMLDVRAESDQAWDCDTWDDVGRARERIAAHHLEEA